MEPNTERGEQEGRGRREEQRRGGLAGQGPWYLSLGRDIVSQAIWAVVLLFLLGIVGVALGVEGTTMSTMLTSVTGVIGTLVGAFFGIRLGSEGKERVEEERAASDALAKSAMGQLEPDQLETVVRKAEDLYGISGPGKPGFE